MNSNQLLDIVEELQSPPWVDKVNARLFDGSLYQWISALHPKKLSVRHEGQLLYGAYNSGMKMVFEDGTAWFLRFVRPGTVHRTMADEKVVAEVSTIAVIREKTSIPVPRVHTWGLTESCPVGLGAFIIMDFIEGIALGSVLKNPGSLSRLMRDDMTDDEIEIIYRQFAGFLLQLFQLDFDRIGSVPVPDGVGPPPPIRPLTFKAHSILNSAGVDAFGDRNLAYASATDYFQYVAEQDIEQMIYQPNSICGPKHARRIYKNFHALKSSVPDFINESYDRTKFKLICDDLGLANLMVKSREDLTIIGVIDLEWSYIGPAQLAASAPWWLLQDRPINTAWDCDDDVEPVIAKRYFHYLDIFNRVLVEEEEKMPEIQGEYSKLVKWSQTSGAMWLHMVLSAAFNDEEVFPFWKLRQHMGEDEWNKHCNQVPEDEIAAFVEKKVPQLEQYRKDVEEMEAKKALVDSGDMSREDFLALYLKPES